MTDKIIMTLLVNAAVFSVLFCVMLLLRKTAGKKISPVLTLVMWAVISIKLIIPFGFESGFSILPVKAAAESAPYDYTQTVENIPEVYAETDNAIRPADGGVNAAAEPEPNSDTPVNTAANIHRPAVVIDWPAAALGAWGAGVMAVGLVLYLSAVNLRKRIRHARMETPRYILELAEQCKKELGISRDVGVTVQSAVDKPVIMGALKPVLVLPENAERLNRETLRHVLLHELTHYKGGDLWAILFMNALRALYWFNPFVWVCFKLIREDIETACDQRVIKALGPGHRLSYISTVLSFAGSRTPGRFAAAMGLFDGRPSMERRIKSMFGKAKTGIRGRITAALAAVFILAASALTACQPAAENTMNTEKVESRWEYSKEYGSDRSLSVDAAVYSVEAESLPVLTVIPKPFESGEKIEAITELFCPNANIYCTIQRDDVSSNVVLHTAQGEDVTLNGVVVSPDDPGKAYALTTKVYTLTAVEDGSKQLNLVAVLEDSKNDIDFVNWGNDLKKQDSSKGSCFLYESDKYNHGNSETYDILVTPESLSGDSGFRQAKEKADGYVKGMGIDYMSLSSVSRGEGSYSFYYTRKYNGLPETYVQTHTGTNVTAVDGAPTIILWDAEYLYIEIQNGNVVKARWENPSEIKNVDNSNSGMLPWERVKEIFLEQMDGMMASSERNEANTYLFLEGTEVVINRVELGYTKLLTEGSKDEYKLVPTWMFLGYHKNEGWPLNEDVNMGADTCFMTINAIDGTVIDRGQGL